MWKRFMLALLFVGALGVASFGISSTAEARGGCHRGGGGFGYYGGYAPYYQSYYAPRRAVYVSPRSFGYYDYGRRHHRHHHGGFSFSIGF